MLEKLKNLDLERMSLEEGVELLAFANSLRATYDAEQIEVPEWLDGRIRELKRELRARQNDAREKRLREIDVRLSALQTPEEKRQALLAERDKLNALTTA